MISTAFLVMYVDVTTTPVATIQGIYLFGEEKPTANLHRFRQFTVLEGRGEDYESGIEHLRLQLRDPRNQWILPLLGDRARANIG